MARIGLVVSFLVQAAAASGTPPRPHIVLIVADDLGSHDVGYSDPTLLSPEIDELAKDGVRLSHCYTYSWCAPSRGALMSGRYAPKSGFEGCGGPTKDGKGLVTVFPLEYQFLPMTLRAAGYKSIMAGKWHLGHAREADLPENRGFDKYLGYLEGGEDYYTREQKVRADNCTSTRDFWFGTPGKGRPAQSQQFWTGEYSTTLYTNWIVEQIDHHNVSQPVFIYASFQGVHYPLEVPKQYFDRYASQGADVGDCEWGKQITAASGYPNGFECEENPIHPGVRPGLDCFCNRLLVKAQVSALSEGIGNITRALKGAGMWDNTVLIFMGDNGGPVDGGHSNFPLRGGKLNFFEGGVRPAVFMTSPLLPAAVRGTEYNGIVHEVDWHATFASLAGVAAPDGIDGLDVWGTLVDPSVAHRDEVLIADHVLRMGRWKLVTGAGQGYGVGAWRTGMLKGCILGTHGGWGVPPTNRTDLCPHDIYTTAGPPNQLGCPDDYPSKTSFPLTEDVDLWLCSSPCTDETPCLWDVEADPEERKEVSAEHPDVVADILKRLHEQQAGFRGATRVRDNGAYCPTAEARRVPGLGLFAGPWIDDDAEEIPSGVERLLV
eukprot:TRINITY_DN42276_c0_g2_i1.p1 TRINITY_DN42276_c0_g2~~TRINITY_DN42276_c0_g2_i1.p1  ORF type:complete len:603 (-),score=82.77 TRINITY_DN42276_c0_g2_i1:106-1914(-)